MKKMRERKGELGFTLIELAMVLVIIGIIIGAILKGQDLINTARTKKFVSKVRSWETSEWSYLDRKGRFTGDSDKDGKIGDGNVKTDFTGANFINPPYEGSSGSETNTITVGSFKFYIYFGTDGGADAGKNVMNICIAADCNTAFSNDELMFAESIDSAIDGSSDGTAGQVIGVNAAPGTVTAAEWEAYHASAPTAAAYSTSTKTVVYYFDRKR